MSKILLCQLGASKIEQLGPDLIQKGYDVVVVSDQEEWGASPLSQVDVILVDASCGLDGTPSCRALSLSYPGTPLILLVAQNTPFCKECKLLTGDNVLRLPFTTRKVTNRLNKLANCHQGEILRVGALTLNLETRCVYRGHAIQRLTPKQAGLLEVFMRHPGQTLTRKFLMETIWNTDYLGDTRTLDVHVRWLRERIEEDPSSPQYLRTVRGVGYRFGVPDENKV
jgi:DNA-binding response OmpR family regulator